MTEANQNATSDSTIHNVPNDAMATAANDQEAEKFMTEAAVDTQESTTKPNLAIILNYPLQNQIDVGHYDVLQTQFENGLENFGHVYVISPRDNRTYASQNQSGITILSNGWSHPLVYYVALLKDIWTLRKLVKKNNAKVIRAMAPTSGFAAVIAGKLTGVKTVVSVHTDEDLAKKDEGRRFLRNVFVNAIVPFVMKRADCVPVISGHIKDYALRKGADEKRIVFHPNFVNTDQFKPHLAPKRPSQILFVGRLSKVKGAMETIDAMALVTKSRTDAELVIAGKGEEETALRQRVQQLGLEKNVRFLGRVDHEMQLPKLMSESAVFLAPQMAGFTLIEAMASGVAIVAGDVEWSRETIQTGHNGILVTAGSVPECADAVLKLLTNPTDAQKMGLAARTMAEEKFSLGAWKERERVIYRGLMNG
ncbi:glycosyltransferase family 4 protein [Candidatus Micrarchaeota archaeon]|nr:glycosyltransferase family 4 protein [Candidatus Micrarchaeota archaeon]